MLTHKHILLGVTGGIAAYKAADLVSRLTKAGAEVEVIMTPAATQFIAPLTFTTLSHHDTHVDTFAPFSCSPQHISIADRGDLFILAPATGNTLAKLARGIADNLLTSTLLASRAPILAAPAMNNRMWEHPATQQNIATLRERGVYFVGPVVGNLACGVTAIGKMAEPEEILAAAEKIFR
jgi:phosphopantothenoylcysteine decarboxylase/phosphopantothenate--cysteine ligase